MQFSTSILLSVLALLSSFGAAAPIEKRSSSPLRLDFNVVRFGANATDVYSSNRFNRKSSGINVPLENEYALYLADIELGTPGQKLRIDIDTGSSDLWVPAVGTESNSGNYDASKSSTYKKIKDGFKIGYGDGSTAQGDWATETVTLGGATVKDIEFGYATKQTAKQGILGVGFKGNEASSQQALGAFTYDNFPVQLKKQGLVKKNAYSLYLNSVDAKAGSILFGAIDHAKYQGDLATLDIVNIDDSGSKTSEPTAFFVNLDKITNADNTLADKTYPALLDSGTTLIYAPKDIAEAFGSKYGKKNPFIGGYVTSCDTKGEDFEFSFGSTSVKVPFKDLLYHTNGKPGSSSGQCLIGVMNSGAEYYILGDAFLRSAYVYYDLDDAKIGIAQVKYTDESNIQEVSSEAPAKSTQPDEDNNGFFDSFDPFNNK